MPNNKEIEKLVREFFKKMTFEADVKVLPIADSSLSIKIKVGEDPQVLIGQGGETLSEIQKLLRIILRKKTAEDFYLDIDINEYKEKKAEYLKEMAKEAADDVALTKKEKELIPMSAYERRIVHMALASREDVASESIGEGSERRIIVKPKIY